MVVVVVVVDCRSVEVVGKGADVQKLQQELTECYKRNSENAQELLELNRKVKELTVAAATKQDQLRLYNPPPATPLLT